MALPSDDHGNASPGPVAGLPYVKEEGASERSLYECHILFSISKQSPDGVNSFITNMTKVRKIE